MTVSACGVRYLRNDFSQPWNLCILDQTSMALSPHCRATSRHAFAYNPAAALVRSGRPEKSCAYGYLHSPCSVLSE